MNNVLRDGHAVTHSHQKLAPDAEHLNVGNTAAKEPPGYRTSYHQGGGNGPV